MVISRDDLLKELLPGLNDLFRYGKNDMSLIQQVKENEALKKKKLYENNIKVSADHSI